MTEFPRAPIGLFCSLVGGGTPNTSKLEYWSLEPDGVPWIAISDMSSVREVKGAKKHVTSEGLAAARLKVSAPGTVLFAMYASVGKHAILEVPAVWNQAIIGLISRNPKRLNHRFLYYSLESVQGLLPTLYRSTTQNNLNAEQVSQLRIPVPCIETQRRIADYLDDEVREMDALIADLERLVSDLRVRKIAFVKNAFSQIDASRGALGLVSKFISGRDWSGVQCDDGRYPVFGSGGKVGSANDYLFEGDAIIFGRKGTLDRPQISRGKVWVIDTAYIAVPDSCLDIDFFYYWSQTLPYDLLSTQTAIPSMTASILKAQSIPFMSLNEQRKIADELDRETAEMDFLIKEAKELIENLKARKTALITEVVTGRKKV